MKGTASAQIQAIQPVAAGGRALLAAVLLALSMALLPVSQADAQNAREGRGISSGQAANIARSATGGKVLSVTLAGSYYRVKVLKPNGVVSNVHVDRASGRLAR